jgi:uncharacterized membrane protein
MIPFVELRGSLPVAIFVYHMDYWNGFLLSVFGNMLPVPFILKFFKYIEKWLRRWKWWNRAFDKLFKRTRFRSKNKLWKYGVPGLIFFVGIPAPFTGAWTGSLISYLFKLEFKRSVFIIFTGVWMAGVIMASICMFAQSMIGY